MPVELLWNNVYWNSFFNYWNILCEKFQIEKWFAYFSKVVVYLFILIRVELLFNVVLVSAVQQCESAICIRIFPPSRASLPPPPPFHPSRHDTAPSWAPCAIYSRFPPAIYFTHGSVHTLLSYERVMLLFQIVPLSPSLLASTRLFATSLSPFLHCK